MGAPTVGLALDEAVGLLEANLWDMWATFGRGDGCALVDTPELFRFETPLAHVPYNSVMRCRLGDDADAVIDEVLHGYDRRGVPLLWVVHPTAAPTDLAERLEARGLVEIEVCPGMAARLADVPEPGEAPAGVQVEELTTSGREDFIELVAWRYSLPEDARPVLRSIMSRRGFGEPGCPTRAWVARMDGRIVSKVAVHTAAGAAGLYGVATRPEARGMGLARHLTLLGFRAARDAGCEVGILHSTPMAVGLYEGIGFRHVAPFRLFSRPGTTPL